MIPTPEVFEALAQRCDLKGPFASWHKGAREDYMALATACRIAAKVVNQHRMAQFFGNERIGWAGYGTDLRYEDWAKAVRLIDYLT